MDCARCKRSTNGMGRAPYENLQPSRLLRKYRAWLIYRMKSPEYLSNRNVSVIPAKAGIQADWGGETNLDSRVRENDESRANMRRKTHPFSFSVGERKIMNHFVVNKPN